MELTSHFESDTSETHDGETFSDRILDLLEKKQRTKAWLAQEIGISKQALQYILDKAKNPKFVTEIADALDVSPAWLETGDGPANDNQFEPHQIPLYTLSDIEQMSQKEILEKKHTMVSSSTALGKECFAFRLNNESMAPLFQMNSILIFDRRKSPKGGDFVLLQTSDTEEILFRELVKDGHSIGFKPLNPAYNIIFNREVKLLGTLVESRTLF